MIRAAVQSRNEHAGYVLSHPKFSDFLRSYFDRNVIKRTRNTFAAWGINSLRQVNRGNSAPLHIPRYLITYLGQHLEDVNYEASGLMGFVEEGWLRAWEELEGGYLGFARDVQRPSRRRSATLLLNVRILDGNFVPLVLSSITSIGVNIPVQLLITSFRARLLTLAQIQHSAAIPPQNLTELKP